MSAHAAAPAPPPNPGFAALRARLEPELAAAVAQYEEPRSALLPIVRRFQDEEGYVSQQAMDACAELLDLPVAVVESTVSFYTLLFQRPVGKYVVQVCRGLGCSINGAEDVMARFRERLGVGHLETTDDGLISYEEVECLAACDRAVCAQVNLDFVHDLDDAKIDGMIAAMRAGSYATPPLAQVAPPGRTWHAGYDTGRKSAGAQGVSDPDSAGGIADRAGGEMLRRIVEELPGVVARSRERVLRDETSREKP